MICKNCGQTVPDGAKFCGSCGTRVQEERKGGFCSICGAKLEPGAQFCASCGTKAGQAAVSGTGQDRGPAPAQKGSGKLLFAPKMFSMYAGEPKMGIAKATGQLSVYDDRLEFKKTTGNALGGAFGLVGMAVAQIKLNKDPILIIPISQIVQLRAGKYSGVYNTLVVATRDGKTVSFCPAVPGSSTPQTIIDTLKPYL